MPVVQRTKGDVMRHTLHDIRWYLIGFVLCEFILLMMFSNSLEKSLATLLLLLVFILLYSGRQGRKALRTSQHYAQNVIESSLDIIITVDIDRRIVEFNKAAQETFGYRKDEVVGQDVGMLYADRDEAGHVSQTVFEKGYYIKEVTNMRKNGEVFQCLLSASILRDPQSQPIGVMGVSRNITEQKRTQEELKRALAQQSVLLENLDVGVVFLRNRKCVWTNRRMEELSGYSHEGLQQIPVNTLYPSRTAFYETGKAASRILAEGGTYRSEIEFQRKDGAIIWCHIAGKAIDPHRLAQGTIWIIEDVTDQKHSEERLRHLNQQLQQANRLKSEFLASMSHELRTPLNAMIGYTSLTLNALRGNISSEHLQNLIKAEHSARVLLQLINDVLDFSKIEAGRLEIFIEEIEPIDIFEDVCASTEGLLSDSSVELREDIPDNLPDIETDFTRLKQILSNLASNAVKFTSEGFVAIRARNLAEQTLIRIEVEDTGSGISPQDAEHIFESFRQADGSMKKNFGGTGLGLAVTKKLCDMLHIEIGFETEIDQGTRFWLHVPWHFAPEPSETSESAAAPEEVEHALAPPSPIIHTEGLSKESPQPPVIETHATVACLAMPEAKTVLSPQLAGLPLEIKDIDSIQELPALCDSDVIWCLLVPPDRRGFEACRQLFRDMPESPVSVMMCSLTQAEPAICIAPVNAEQVLEQEWEQFEARREQTDIPKNFSWIEWIAHRIPYVGIRSVLVVDDNEMNISLMTNVLEVAGYQTHTARSGSAAIETARTAIPGAILMDLAMPGMDGLEATWRIKQNPETRGIPVIACSAFSTQDDKTKAYEEGCEGYITKPIEPNRLVEQVEKYVIRARISHKMKT